jgi:phosphonate transport system substrate-binding protein
MKKLLAAFVATTALTAPVLADDITEFRIGFWAAKTPRTA